MKRALLAATAILSTTFTPLATPAFADVVDPTVQAQLDAYCNALVPPNDDNPPFVVTAINVVVGETIPGGDTTITLVPGTEHRHGGSPNIFEDAHITTSAGSTSYTFDCQTFNPNAASEQGQFPDGLQFPGQTTILQDSGGTSTDTDVVVCNSPTKNPGVWRGQNGYSSTMCQSVATTSPGFYNLPIYSAQTVWDPIPTNSLPS